MIFGQCYLVEPLGNFVFSLNIIKKDTRRKKLRDRVVFKQVSLNELRMHLIGTTQVAVTVSDTPNFNLLQSGLFVKTAFLQFFIAFHTPKCSIRDF